MVPQINALTDITGILDSHQYVADEDFAAALFLLLKLQKPLLVEGPPGVGKTEIALTLAQMLDTRLIRLQCYEGLDINAAVYEWNYQKQLLGIKLQEGTAFTVEEKEKHVFGTEYLLKRPLLQSIMEEEKSPVLLIDELDRADEEFEAFLLELLSAFQVTIPELGTVRAKHKPYVILTSNRTRELSDALKRRCLYHWIDYPSFEKEMLIVRKRLPGIEQALMEQVVRFVQQFRERKLAKMPGVSETIDWAESLVALGYRDINQRAFDSTLGSVLKSADDIGMIRAEGLDAFKQTA
jgi:MoxR-like ATPase